MSDDQESEKLFESLLDLLQTKKIDRKEFLMRGLGAGLSLGAIGAFLSKAAAKPGDDKGLSDILSNLPGGSTTTVPLDKTGRERIAADFSNWPNNGWGRSPPLWGNSDLAIKHDTHWLARLDNGLNLYCFKYLGGDTRYVGVMAQEVQQIMPNAVVRAVDGYLHVNYDLLGLKLQTYADWLVSGLRARHAGIARLSSR
jgi:hypothetical protein